MSKLDAALAAADIAYADATYAARAKRRKARIAAIEDWRLSTLVKASSPYLNRPLRTEAQARADQAYEEGY